MDWTAVIIVVILLGVPFVGWWAIFALLDKG